MTKAFVKLTRPAMRKMKSGTQVAEHGITFKRSANGVGVFTINVMVDGQRIHRVVGRESDGTTRTHAEQFIEKVRRDARDNRLALPKGRKIALGFGEAADKYLARSKEEGGKDLDAKRWRLGLHLKPFFGNAPISRLSSFDIERYKKHRATEGVKPGTINRELAALSHLLNKAIEWGWLDRRPAKIRRLQEGQGRITYLTIEQCKQLIDAAAVDQNQQVYPFIVIGLGTSMRRMEILSIRREHVDLQRKVIWIPKAKAGAREQPITSQVAEFLTSHVAALQPGTPWLFPSMAAREGHTVEIVKAFRRVVVRAGLDPYEVVRHTLRHTAITHLVQAGVDLPTIKRISGHKTLAMVEKYAHANGEHIRAAMNKLEERYSKTG